MKYKFQFHAGGARFSSRWLFPFIRFGWNDTEDPFRIGYRYGWFFIGWWRSEIGVTWNNGSEP